MMWKNILGYEGKYEVSSSGQVRSMRYNNTSKIKILSQKTNRGGYQQVTLCSNGKTRTFSVHRLVAQAFLPNYSDDTQVNHIDCDKKNNAVSNLEMCTQQENMNHARRNGLLKTLKGDDCPTAKLTSDIVREIRKSPKRNIELAKEYGVHRSLVSMVRRGKIWKDVV